MRKIIIAFLISLVALACISEVRAQSLTDAELPIYKEIIHRQYVLVKKDESLVFDKMEIDKIVADVASGYKILAGTAQDIYDHGLRRPLTAKEEELSKRIADKIMTLPKDAPDEDYDRAVESVVNELGITLEDEFELEMRLAVLEGKPE